MAHSSVISRMWLSDPLWELIRKIKMNLKLLVFVESKHFDCQLVWTIFLFCCPSSIFTRHQQVGRKSNWSNFHCPCTTLINDMDGFWVRVVPAEGKKLIGRKPINLIVGWCGRFFFFVVHQRVARKSNFDS